MSSLAHLILLVLAVVCFGIASWQYGNPTWNRMIAVGLTAMALAMIPF